MIMTTDQIRDLWMEISDEITSISCMHPEDDVIYGIISRWVERQP